MYVTMAIAASLRVCSRQYEKQTAAVNIRFTVNGLRTQKGAEHSSLCNVNCNFSPTFFTAFYVPASVGDTVALAGVREPPLDASLGGRKYTQHDV